MEKNKFGDIEILTPMCNPSTITDGRGAIFSWIPEDAIKEFTMLFFYPVKCEAIITILNSQSISL